MTALSALQAKNTSWQKAAVAVAVFTAITLALFWQTGASIVDIWLHNNAYGHGFLIPLIVAWLIHERRQSVAALRPRADGRWLVGVAAAAIFWLLGTVLMVQIATQLALIGLLVSGAFLILGPEVSSRLRFPILFLFLGVPMGSEITPHLQIMTADIAVAALREIGVAVYHNDLEIVTTAGHFVIANECSGLNFLIASLTLGILVAERFYTSWPRRIAFLLLTLVMPIVANGLRAFGIILIADTVGMHFAASVDHIIYGWVFLTLITAILLAIGWSFHQNRPALAAVPAAATPSPAPARPLWGMAAAGLVPMLACAALAGVALRPPANPAPHLALPGDAAAKPADGGWTPVIPGSDINRLDTFQVGDVSVTRAVAYFAWQRPGAKAVSGGSAIVPYEWAIKSTGTDTLTLGGQTFTAPRLDVLHQGHERIVWSWYWVDGRFTGSPIAAKLLQIRALFDGQRAAAVIAVAMPAPDKGQDQATAVLTAFLHDQEDLGTALAQAAGP